jgi:hypothetical protein
VAPRLFTAAWFPIYTYAVRFGPLPVQPIRISHGWPRYWPEARLFPAIPELMPPHWVFAVAKTDPERADRGYRRGLHILGVDRVRALIEGAVGDDPRPPALCCFESDWSECHRGPTGFAGWWECRTGERVSELSLMQSYSGAAALVWEVSTA